MDLNVKKSNSIKETFSILSNQTDLVYPTFNEDRGEWIKAGPSNRFPDELLELFEKSGIHNGIIESKVRMMSGDGITQDIEHEKEFDINTQNFIDNPNPSETLDQIYYKLSLDFEIHGLAYLEVIWSRDYSKVAEIYHVDATKIRWGKANPKGKVETFYYSRDFGNYRKANYTPIPLPIYDPNKKEPRQILPIVKYTPGFDYYALPDYFAGLKWIHIDTEIANFHFNNLINGMTPTIFFGFPVGEKSNEEREAISSALKEKYQGTNNAGQMLLAFYDAEGDKKPEIEVIEMSNAAKQYDLLNKTSLQQILIAHKVVNENLVGISTPGKLGSTGELLASYELYFNTVVKPEQQKVLNSIEKIFLQNDYNEIKIINNKPVDFEFSEATLKEILTKDEMRELIGYEMLSEEENTASIEEIENENEIEAGFASVRMINGENFRDRIPVANLDDIYVWKTEKDPCKICKERDGVSRTLDQWLTAGIPACPTGTIFDMEDGSTEVADFAHSPYNSFCEENCKCKLTKIGTSN